MFFVVLLLLASSLIGQSRGDTRDLIDGARAALEQNRLPDARAAATEALRRNPKLGDAEVILGLVATAERDLPAAESHFSRAVVLQPSNPRVHGYLGSTYLAQKRLDEAARSFTRVLKLDPSNSTAHYNLGMIASLQKKPESALQHFQAVVAAHPADVAALGALLQTQIVLRRAPEARATAGRLLKALPPGDPRVSEVGALLASSGDYVGALPALEQAYRASPQSADAAYNLGLALFKAGREEPALSLLLKFPQSGPALNLIGTIEESRGRYGEAKAAFSKAANIEPRNEGFRIDAAAILVREADPSGALEAFEQAARDFPRSLRVRIGLGSAYYLAGKFENAAGAFLEALAMDSSATLVYDLLSRTYESAPQHAIGIESAFRRYVAAKPRNADAYCAYAAILIGKSGAGPAEIAEAKELLQRALRIDPESAEAHLQLGVIAQNEGDIAGAIRFFERATAYAPDSSRARYRLASVYARAGRADESRAAMQLFQRLKTQEAERDRALIVQSLAQRERR